VAAEMIGTKCHQIYRNTVRIMENPDYGKEKGDGPCTGTLCSTKIKWPDISYIPLGQ